MNVLFRRPARLRITLARATSTATPFVPPDSLQELKREFRRVKIKPESPTFYTSRAKFHDQVNQLESAIQYSRSALTNLMLLPLPEFARAKLPPIQKLWKPKDHMSSAFGCRLTTSHYRRLTTLLAQLSEYQNIASTAGCHDLGKGISDVLQLFQRDDTAVVLARGKRKEVKFDEYGRTYTLGKRKTSSARVWMIPVEPKTDATMAHTLLGLVPPQPASMPSSPSPASSLTRSKGPPKEPFKVTTATVLVNNMPLAEYFSVPTDRERVIRPFKVTGLLCAYNVFALARGGGTSGQSGAIAHGIAKGLAAHEPDVLPILQRGKQTFSSLSQLQT